jgi:hypothetical protein
MFLRVSAIKTSLFQIMVQLPVKDPLFPVNILYFLQIIYYNLSPVKPSHDLLGQAS